MFRRSAEDKSRKRNAVVALYETHYNRVVRYIAARIGNISDAEDLASEVFVRALRSAHKFKETGAPMEAWIFKIAHNIVVDYHRMRGRNPSYVALDEASSLSSGENITEHIELQQEIERLYGAMTELTDAQRQVLALRFGAEMTSEQVAEILGRNPGAVREMQSAAIKKLRQTMAEQ